MITLKFGETELSLTNDSYKETLKSVENTYVTEAGTKIRNIVRSGIYGLSISYKGTETEKVILDSAVKQDYLNVIVWDETEAAPMTHRMYIDPASYGSSLIVEDDNHRYYELTFTLEDLE